MLSCTLAPMLCIANVSSILLRTNQPGKEDRKDSHHKLSALLSLIFGRSSSWCSMTNKATASSIQLECHRRKKSQHPPCVHALMLSWSLAPMPMLCITKVSSILLHANQPGKEDRKDSHHKLSALLSLMFGRSSSWCSMTNNLACSLASSRSSLFHSRGHSSRNENYVLLAIRHEDPCQLATPESEETKIGHLQVCREEVLNSVSPTLLKKPFAFCVESTK